MEGKAIYFVAYYTREEIFEAIYFSLNKTFLILLTKTFWVHLFSRFLYILFIHEIYCVLPLNSIRVLKLKVTFV